MARSSKWLPDSIGVSPRTARFLERISRSSRRRLAHIYKKRKGGPVEGLRLDLKCDPGAMRASVNRCAENIPFNRSYSSVGIISIGACSERMKDALLVFALGELEFEDRAISASAGLVGRTIKIPARVNGETTRVGVLTVCGSAREAVENGLTPSLVLSL